MKKYLSLFLTLFLLNAQAIAEPPPRFFVITSFENGLNTQASHYSTPQAQGYVAKNVRFNKVYRGVAKRNVNLSYGTAGSHTIESMHRYYKTSVGLKKLIVTGSTNIYVGDDDAGTFQTIGQGFSDGERWNWVTYKDIAIGMNGSENAVKYDGKTNVTANTDGHRTASDVVTELGAPFAELNTGSNLDASSWYQYKVAFYNGTTYSYSTARSNPINTGSSVRDITLTDIPIGPTGTTIRYIYRTSGHSSRTNVLASSTYYLVDDIADNTTTTFNDAIADATIETDPAPTWATVSAGTNATPPTGKYSTIHHEKLFISGNDDNKNDIYWSDSFNPDFFKPQHFEQIRPDDGDEVTFLKEQLGILTIGKTNTIQKFYAEFNNAGDFTGEISDPFSFIGCPAPYSVANTPKGIFYLGRDGVYRFTGQAVELVSDAVTPEIRDILPSNFDKTAGYYFKNEYHLAYTSLSTGGTTNNRVLVYDFIRNAYSLDYKNINVFEAFDSGDDFGVLYHGSSETDGLVYADEGSPNVLSTRFKSDFNLGTYDDTRLAGLDDAGHPHLPTGTENKFWLDLAWDSTVNTQAGTINGTSGNIDRPDTDGTWTSPVYRVNASLLEQLQWNEILGAFGDVTFQIRTCSTSGGCAAEAWSSEFSDPNGSDLTGLTAQDYLQLRINLTTTDIEESDAPRVYPKDNYVWRLFYQKSGSAPEPDFESQWQSGRLDFAIPGHKKFIRRIRVYYRGDEGTLNFNYKNDEGDVNRNFDIDMATNVDLPEDDYRGEDELKYFTHYPATNQEDDPGPTGEFWIFTITEEGADEWEVHKVEVEFYAEPGLID